MNLHSLENYVYSYFHDTVLIVFLIIAASELNLDFLLSLILCGKL